MEGARFLFIATIFGAASAIVCNERSFPCQNGVKCIHKWDFCDGQDNCGDESDEIPPNESAEAAGTVCQRWGGRRCVLPDVLLSRKDELCQKNPECQFRCTDGRRCLYLGDFCNGYTDCRDGSDEILRNFSNPESLTGFACRYDKHICVLPKTETHQKKAICKKDPFCTADEFLCNDGTECIDLSKYCDGDQDCKDGSDEIKASSSEVGILCRHEKYICRLPEKDNYRKDEICTEDPECDENQFRCADGDKCIDASDFCDGINNCWDGSDEIVRDLTLATKQPGIVCRRSNLICMIPEKYDLQQRNSICKANHNCDEDEFACMDGSRCVANNRFCDGKKHCRDGSDEIPYNVSSPISGMKCNNRNRFCILPISQTNKMHTLCEKKSTCDNDEFACLDGSRCISAANFCDGNTHCSDGSDEIKTFHPDSNVTGVRCRQTKYTCLLHDNETIKSDVLCTKDPECGPDEFTCADGLQCLPKTKFCDNVIDCRDGSDELKRNRSEVKELDAVPCRRDKHVCWLSRSQIDKRSSLCQKVPKCSKKEFACSDGTTCLPISGFCNGSAECPDGSDEMIEGSNNPAAKGGYRCRREQHKCILPAKESAKRSNICKKKFACGNREFACQDNLRCLPSWWFCDGDTDCADGSDELEASSGNEGILCRRHPNTCLLPTNQISKRNVLCRNSVQ